MSSKLNELQNATVGMTVGVIGKYDQQLNINIEWFWVVLEVALV